MAEVVRAKPATAKGQFIRTVVSSTMGPGVRIDAREFTERAQGGLTCKAGEGRRDPGPERADRPGNRALLHRLHEGGSE